MGSARRMGVVAISMLSGLLNPCGFEFGRLPVSYQSTIPAPDNFGRRQKLKGWQKKNKCK